MVFMDYQEKMQELCQKSFLEIHSGTGVLQGLKSDNKRFSRGRITVYKNSISKNRKR
jgi:hypothetical protein